MAKKASTGVPRPANAWMIFRSETRLRYQRGSTQQANISQLVSLEWHSLSQAEKDVYYRKAELVKAAHALKYPDYKYNPKSKEQKAAEKAAAQAVKEQEAERKRAAKRAKTSESSYIPNNNQLTYTQAAVHAAAPPAAVNPPTPPLSDAPAASPESTQPALPLPKTEGNELFAPFPHVSQSEHPQWLDPTLGPAVSDPIGFIEYHAQPQLKRTFEEMVGLT